MSQACEMFAKHYGETSIECAEPSFLYGKALLELARLEAGVINNGLDGGTDVTIYKFLNPVYFMQFSAWLVKWYVQGTLTEGRGSVQLTSVN